MPWKETCAMDERICFITAYLSGEQTMTSLCGDYEISRKTGYKWLRRYGEGGYEGLRERSHASVHHPNAVPRERVDRIVALRRQRRWGAAKLVAYLRLHEPDVRWPAPSTAGAMLKREGLIARPKRRRRAEPYGEPLLPSDRPNAVWAADYKGQFWIRGARKCYPLTVSDGYSRYVLGCEALPHVKSEGAWPRFDTLFRRYGLPQAIRTDNGPPFATNGKITLSRLSVWWTKLGIRHERIAPGHPEQNGRHERMHRTLKYEALQLAPQASSFSAQQRVFDHWRYQFNHHRPHQALGQRPPASFYQPSSRPYPRRCDPIAYPPAFQQRQVRQNGSFKWHSQLYYLGYALVGEPVGLEPIDDARWRIYFGTIKLGILDESLEIVLPITPG